MVFIREKHSGTYEKTSDFRTTVVEYNSPPIFMLTLQRIGVFIKISSVEFIEPELVFRKMRRYPVEYDAYTRFVKLINHYLEIFGRTVT